MTLKISKYNDNITRILSTHIQKFVPILVMLDFCLIFAIDIVIFNLFMNSYGEAAMVYKNGKPSILQKI